MNPLQADHTPEAIKVVAPPTLCAYTDPAAERDLAFAQLQRTMRDLMLAIRERDDALASVQAAHHETLLKLASAAEFKDGDTGEHLTRIGCISELVARAYGTEVQYARLLRMAAPMHDIGKIGIPDQILKKPGPLDDDEWQVMRQHPAMGARILGNSRTPLLTMAAEVALCHHEKFDGSGYPGNLRGDAIPLSAAIVGLVDYFDALTMDRCYRKALPDVQVIQMIREQTGRHFDPAVAEVFLDNIARIVELRETINSGALPA